MNNDAQDTPTSEEILSETLAIGLDMQHKFKPEPLYKHTGNVQKKRVNPLLLR